MAVSTKGVDSGTELLRELTRLRNQEEFPDLISKYDVERTDSRICLEGDEESTVPRVGTSYQCLRCVAKPVFYERLRVKVTTSEGKNFERDMIFSTHFKPDLLTELREEEIQKFSFERFSKTNVKPSDFYSLKNDIIQKLKTRQSDRIADCYSVRLKFLNELFPRNQK